MQRRESMGRRARAAGCALLVMLAAPLAQAHGGRGHPAHETLAGEDPAAEVFVVTARSTWDAGLATLGRTASPARSATGEPLVIARLRAGDLPELSRHVHAVEQRCGGFFAFASRGEAERFVRADASRRGITHTFGGGYSIDRQPLVTRWMGMVEEPRIRGTIQHLSTAFPNRYYATNHGRNAAQWIADEWWRLSWMRRDVTVELVGPCGNCGIQPSVVMTIPGRESADEIVVVGGHLDSISNSGSGEAMNAPGADDDASGIATMTEVIRIVMRDGWQPKRTVKFMAYAAEEVGLRGSRALAQQHANAGLDVVGVLQMDMTNYRAPSATTTVRVMTDNSNAAQVQFMRDLFAEYLAPQGHTLGSSSCGYACSDHASWTQAGFPAGMYDEGPFFPSLHTANDTLANVGGTANHATVIAKLGLAFVAELAKVTDTPRHGVPRVIHPPGGEPPRGPGRGHPGFPGHTR